MTLWGSESLKLSPHVCLAQLDRHQICKPVIVSCEFNSQWRQLYFLRHLYANFVEKWQKCQIWVIYENLVYFSCLLWPWICLFGIKLIVLCRNLKENFVQIWFNFVIINKGDIYCLDITLLSLKGKWRIIRKWKIKKLCWRKWCWFHNKVIAPQYWWWAQVQDLAN